MPSDLAVSFVLKVNQTPSCWTGTPTLFELKLKKPLPVYTLEQLRARFMHAVTTTHQQDKSARAVFQLAFETEIKSAIGKLIEIPSDVQLAIVCERRSYISVDKDMALFKFLLEPALEAVQAENILPETYIRLFRQHLASHYAQYRVCATAALLCVATQTLIP